MKGTWSWFQLGIHGMLTDIVRAASDYFRTTPVVGDWLLEEVAPWKML